MKLLDYNGILSKRYALIAVFSILALLAFASSARAGCCFLNNYQINVTAPSIQDCIDAGGSDFFDADCSSPELGFYTEKMCCVINVSGTPQCYYGSIPYVDFIISDKHLTSYDVACSPGNYGSDGFDGCIFDTDGGCPTPGPVPNCTLYGVGCLNYNHSSLFCTESGSIVSNCSFCLNGNCGGLVCNEQTGICENRAKNACEEAGFQCCDACEDENGHHSTFDYSSTEPNNCPQNLPKCCESCAPQSVDCCKYSWQCSYALPSIDTCAGTNCGSACLKPQCALEQPIKSSSNSYPACWCKEEERNTSSDNGYCCLFGWYGAPCSTASLSVYGKITDAGTKAPVAGALVIIQEEGTASEKTGSDGKYQISGLAPDEYTLVAYALNYYLASQIVEVGSSPVEVNFTIQNRTSPGCNTSGPSAITGFNATHAMQGRADIKISWDQKCQPMISAYYLQRNGWTSPKMISPSLGEYIDSDGLQWNTTYTYKIWAVYKLGQSSPVSTTSFKTGNALCEGVYIGDEFCAQMIGGRMQKNTADANLRRTCNSLNQVVDSAPALYINESIDGYYQSNCSKYSENRKCMLSNLLFPNRVLSRCALSNVCQESGNPFGLFYSKESCSQDACFYDFSRTTVDSCNSCKADLTCSEFKSADACEKNSCGINCTWEYTNAELGKGICYSQLGNVSSCDECNSMFVDCTEEECSRLGICMLKDGICSSCSNAMICKNYTSQDSCERNYFSSAVFESCINGQLSVKGSTDDACNMLRCAWNGTHCVKDGNYDGSNDCASCIDTSANALCNADNTAPITSVTGFGYSPSGGAYFNFSVSEPVSNFAYCLSKGNDICCPDLSEHEGGVISFNLRIIGGIGESGIYYLRYYSVDQYNNQETIRSFPILISGRELGASLLSYFTDANKYNLTVLVDIDDLRTANCSFTIDGDASSKVVKNTFVAPASHFEVDFANLDHSKYLFSLNCTSGDLAYNNYYVLIKPSSSKFNISIVTPYSKDGLPAVTRGTYNVIMNFSESVSISSLKYILADESYSKDIPHLDGNGKNWNFTMEIPSDEAAISGINKPAMIAVTANTGSEVLTENDANSPYFIIDTKAPEVNITIT
jgi:hypothetical protein